MFLNSEGESSWLVKQQPIIKETSDLLGQLGLGECSPTEVLSLAEQIQKVVGNVLDRKDEYLRRLSQRVTTRFSQMHWKVKECNLTR